MDYALAMKSDDGHLVTKHLALLLRLNLMFKQKNAYSRCMFFHMLLLFHQRKHKLPSWQMYTKSASVFNEEVGEISLSVLGRAVLGDTLQSDFEHMSKIYLLQHQYRAVTKDIRTDQNRKTRSSGSIQLGKRELILTKTTEFILASIERMEAGPYRVYTGPLTKTNPAYMAKAVSSTFTREERKNIMPFWLAHSSNANQIDTVLEKLRLNAVKTYFQTWGFQIRSVWPEMGSIPPRIRESALARAAPDIAMLRNRAAVEDADEDESSESEESSEADDGVPPLEHFLRDIRGDDGMDEGDS